LNPKAKMEVAVGVFIVFGILALMMLAFKVSNLSVLSGDDGYKLTASFDNIGGLKVRSPVMMAGVRVGQVSNVVLDLESFEAVVTLRVFSQYNNLPKDTSASIFTSGLLGEQYIGLEAGGEERVLKEGDTLTMTQSAVVLEQIIGQFLFSKAAGDD